MLSILEFEALAPSMNKKTLERQRAIILKMLSNCIRKTADKLIIEDDKFMQDLLNGHLNSYSKDVLKVRNIRKEPNFYHI